MLGAHVAVAHPASLVRRGVDQDARARARLHGFSGGAGVAHGGELRVGAQRLWREPELLQQVRCDAGALLTSPIRTCSGSTSEPGPDSAASCASSRLRFARSVTDSVTQSGGLKERVLDRRWATRGTSAIATTRLKITLGAAQTGCLWRLLGEVHTQAASCAWAPAPAPAPRPLESGQGRRQKSQLYIDRRCARRFGSTPAVSRAGRA